MISLSGMSRIRGHGNGSSKRKAVEEDRNSA
jgi:hypothetical protein